MCHLVSPWDSQVSNSERWTGNPDNVGGEKSQDFAGIVRQNERTYIGVLHGAQKYQKTKVQIEMEERCANDDLE